MEDAYTKLMEYIKDHFEDIEDTVLADLENSNEEYNALMREVTDLDDKCPFIWQALYGEGEISLDVEEHAILFEYLMMENEMHDIERRAIYTRGLVDALTQTDS